MRLNQIVKTLSLNCFNEGMMVECMVRYYIHISKGDILKIVGKNDLYLIVESNCNRVCYVKPAEFRQVL